VSLQSENVRFHLDLPHNLDASAYFVSNLGNQGPAGNVHIPSYARLDRSLKRKLGERFTVSVVGQNLLKDHHLEFDDVFGSMPYSQIKRTAFAQVG
jgi:hypothetical protein